MRSVINHQMMFGQTDISAIQFNEKSRDDMPKILRALQAIYTNIELRKRVFSILEEVRPERNNGTGKADPRTGRPGLDQWSILVMGVVISNIHKEFQTKRQITTIMGELLRILPRYEFEKLEKQHRSNHYTKYYTGWQQLVTLLFAQIAGHDSLRAIQRSLGVHSHKWYHLGLDDIKRSTLS